MTYEDAVRAIGEDAAARVAAVLASGLSDDERGELLALVTAAANTRAAAAGTLAFLAALLAAYGEDVTLPPLPPVPEHHTDEGRLRAAYATVLALDAAQHHDRARRVVLSETTEAAAATYGDALRADGRVQGWVRALDSSACELCRWWHRDGRVWPASLVMPRHKGCMCTQRPVLVDSVQSVDARTIARSERDRRKAGKQ